MKLSDILAERVGDEKAYYFIIIVNSISSFVTACQHTFSGFDSRRLHHFYTVFSTSSKLSSSCSGRMLVEFQASSRRFPSSGAGTYL